MSDRCVEVRGRDSELSEGVDLVAARRLTRSMSKAIKDTHAMGGQAPVQGADSTSCKESQTMVKKKRQNRSPPMKWKNPSSQEKKQRQVPDSRNWVMGILMAPRTPGLTEEDRGREFQLLKKKGVPEVVFASGPLTYQNKLAIYAATKVMCSNLVSLQPLVDVAPLIDEATIVIIEEALRMKPSLLDYVKTSNGGLLALTAAAFWILAKFGGVRSATPNALLMCQAAQSKRDNLKRMEILLLDALSWDIAATVRRKGLSDIIM